MNKYQEALNDVDVDYQDQLKNWKTSLPKWEYEKTKNQVKENVYTLQELINNMKFVEEVQTPDYIKAQNENEILEKALDMLLDLSVDKESGICCVYDCPNKDIDIESGSCIGKCMTKEELKDYLFRKVRNNNE